MLEAVNIRRHISVFYDGNIATSNYTISLGFDYLGRFDSRRRVVLREAGWADPGLRTGVGPALELGVGPTPK